MIFFKKYTDIKNFLYRFTLLKIGKLHIRIHKIVDCDRTNFYHNHPFHYISIILKGGYIDKVINDGNIKIKKYKFLSFIIRDNKQYHRIDKIFGETITLFIAFGNYGWDIICEEKNNKDDGVYLREINGKEVWSKRYNGIYYIGHSDYNKALNETRYSIHQI